ncbi:MAG: ATP-binding protein [Spirochaetes bacterium]|nr:ATP-binding protein [Spirochaetota bacterium]
MNKPVSIEYDVLLDSIQAPVFVIDASKNIIDINNHARRLFYSIDIIGKSCKDIFPECEKSGNCPIDAADYRIPTGCERLKQTMVLNTVKEQVEVCVVPIKTQKDILFFHILTDNDIQNRQNLVMLEKNMTISTLASGIAHEFNNMNAGIQGIVELLLSQEDLSSAGKKDLKTILKIVKRATHLIDQLSILAHRKPSKYMLVNIEDIVNDCISIIKPQFLDAGIAIEVLHKEKIPELFLDANMVTLALMNILLNARDAMISTTQKKLMISTSQDDYHAYITIKDTGCGIKAENVQRIFEPFFTTKGPLGHSNIPGTGLGLSVALGIIEEHGGTITVESMYGQGTTFTIQLPINTDDKVATEVAVNYTEYDFSGKRILIVEDDPEFANVLQRALMAKNAEVVFANTGSEGLYHLDNCTIDLALLDVHLPDMTVWDILKKIQYMNNRPNIIIVSGNYLAMNNNYINIVDYVLLKPFDLEELFNAIQNSLSA